MQQVNVDLQINNSSQTNARYLSWAPSPCRVRITDPSGTAGPSVRLTISRESVAPRGGVVFRTGAAGTFSNSLTLSVPTNGTSVNFFIAGKFGQPSVNDRDVA